PQVAGQSARPRRRDRRRRRGQPERFRQGAEADRRGDERLLRARVHVEESRPDQAPAPGGSACDASETDGVGAEGIRAEAAAETYADEVDEAVAEVPSPIDSRLWTVDCPTPAAPPFESSAAHSPRPPPWCAGSPDRDTSCRSPIR